MLAICLLIAIFPGSTTQDEPQAFANRVKPYLVSMAAYDSEGGIRDRGFGLFVSDAGDAVARTDIIEGATRVEIGTADGQKFNLSRLIAKDAEAQMVLFHVEVPKGGANPVKVAQAVPKTGEQVGVIVASGQSVPTIMFGTVKNAQLNARWYDLEIAGSLPLGSLGNPVFNMNGEFVGIAVHETEGTGTFTVRAGERLYKMVEEMLAARNADSGRGDQAGHQPGTPLSTKGIPQVGAVLQGMAIKRVEPAYPRSAKGSHITGTVVVEVTIDEAGNVTAAHAVKGRFQRPVNVSDAETRKIIPDLQNAAVVAARQWKFAPTKLSGRPVKVIGTLTFNFVM